MSIEHGSRQNPHPTIGVPPHMSDPVHRTGRLSEMKDGD